MNLFNRIIKNPFLNAFASSFTAIVKKTIHSGFDQPTNPVDADYRFIYRYKDAPLPPDFHRSYTISVTVQKIHISIDSYGKVLSKKSLPVTKSKYQSFVTALLELNIKGREEVKPNGCTGGTSEEIDIYAGKDYAVKGYIYHCGSESFGNLQGDVAKAAALFKALIPNLKNRINDPKL